MTKLLILGGAKCVWDDIASLGIWEHEVAAVNDIGARWKGPLVFWVSLHPRKLKDWETRRIKNGYPQGYVKYSNRSGYPMVDFVIEDWGGSSGLYAIKIALQLGYKDIIIAGMPMDAEQAHYFSKSKKWKEADGYRKAWLEKYDLIAPYVKSCSGWTKELLGGPE